MPLVYSDIMIKIVTVENKVLRQIAQEVPVDEIKKTKIKKVISDMKNTLAGEKHGVAIAAAQIGINLRIFVVAGKIFDAREGADRTETKVAEEGKKTAKHNDQTFINPKIIKKSKNKKELCEGCLSVPYLYGTVERFQKVTISYFDEDGHVQTRGTSGFLAQIFQHELDHLDGILYTDKAKEVHDVDENFNKID